MIPNLLQATNDYWRKLNELEAAYQRGEVSLEEVDAKVAVLIADLNQERRESLAFVFNGLNSLWNQQKEVVIGLGLIGMLTYTWIVVS
ncbi:MAG: hypothetical protein KME13_12535 [Myxacorys californica WJT36-NPBG1]|jgi:hypothetical protein|nr:hypothetical protein [Myxacorys californica WJT36-NPBG1]